MAAEYRAVTGHHHDNGRMVEGGRQRAHRKGLAASEMNDKKVEVSGEKSKNAARKWWKTRVDKRGI